MTVLTVVATLLGLFYLLAILTGYRFVRGMRELRIPVVNEPPQPAPFVSVIVPARNEEDMIERCVTSLAQQAYAQTDSLRYEVVVVNDNSTDRTGEILEELTRRFPHLRAVNGQPLPDGWCGKPFALHQGQMQAKRGNWEIGKLGNEGMGKWLLFIDADTWHHPQMLSSVMSFALSRNVEMLSLMTDQEIVTFWEKVIQPIAINFLVRLFTYRRVNDPDDPLAIANGQFILIRCDAYDRLGGHERVKGEVIEDLELARAAKRDRLRFMVADGRALVRTRMYTGLRDLWHGWTKVVYTNRDMTPGKLAACILVTALLGLVPLTLLIAAFATSTTGDLFFWASVAQFLIYLWHWAEVNLRLKIPVVYALANPVRMGLMIAMMLTSAAQVISGRGVVWKGRRY